MVVLRAMDALWWAPRGGKEARQVVKERPPSRTRSPVTDGGGLALRALRGDDQAWNELVRLHNHRVVVSLLARGVRITRARELANDTWLRLIQKQRAGQLHELTLPGLAIRQAAFLALDELRSAESQRVLVDGERVDRVVDGSADPERRAIHGQRLERAQAALGRCGPRAREIFLMVYRDNQAHTEVAGHLGISLQRVRQTLCEVRKRLKTEMEEGT